MTNFNPFTEYYLVGKVLEGLNHLGYRNDIKVSTPDALKTLKERLVTGPLVLTIDPSNRFRVVVSATNYREAVCKRHYFGVRRIGRLARSSERLAAVKWATAWTLTTYYYTAFFSALELMELTGRHIVYLSSDEVSQLAAFAQPGTNTLAGGNYLGVATLGANADEIEISFGPSGIRPHEFAWEQLTVLVRSVVAESPDAIRHQGSMIRFLGRKGGSPWKKPNEVRNIWNYSDVTLFCEHGETVGRKMVEYVTAPKDAIAWGVGKHLHACEENHATGISYICASLSRAIDNVAGAILPENLARKAAS